MFELVAIVICILGNGILAGSEIAFIAANKATLKALAEKGDRNSELLLQLRSQPEKVLSTIQIGITFLGAFAAAIGGAGAQEKISPFLSDYLVLAPNLIELISTLIIVIPLTYFSVVIGELVPKTIALRQPMRIAALIAPWLHMASRIVFPLAKVFEWSTKKIIAYLPSKARGSGRSEKDDLVIQDSICPFSKQYILNMVKISRAQVKDIFHEWKYSESISSQSTIEEVEEKLISSGHTRLPIEKDGEVIGVLNSKEFFAFQKTGEKNWMKLSRNPVKVQSNTLILNALRVLQKNTMHMAIVYEKEQLIGIVTIEDILEEVVGEIYDEDDDGSIQRILYRTTF